MTELSEQEFNKLADETLVRIERAVESCGIDADVQLKEGGVLEIEFDNGSKIIVNRHSAAKEIWVAARSGGHHFRYTEGTWRHTRQGTELFAALSGDLSLQSGESVSL